MTGVLKRPETYMYIYIYESGQTIKGSMGPKIGFWGVAYRWIEKPLCLLLLRACPQQTAHAPAKFLNVNLGRTTISRQDIYRCVENHALKFQFFRLIK